MGMVKSFYHEEICAMSDNFDEAEYWAFTKVDETEIDWFSDSRLAHDGYQEFECQLCGGFNNVEVAHSECHDREQAWSDLAGEDLPF
jgi:hypothetical protein